MLKGTASQKFSRDAAARLLLYLRTQSPLRLTWDHSRYRIHCFDPNSQQPDSWIFQLRLPLCTLFDRTIQSVFVSARSSFAPSKLNLVLIRSGEAYLVEWDAAESESATDSVSSGKRLRYYTVRKEHGKDQQKHLRTKGKSRGGGKIRLKQHQKFVEELCTLLEAQKASCPHFLIGCPDRLWGQIRSHMDTPLGEFISVPFHFQTPSPEAARQIVHLGAQAEVHFSSSQARSQFSELLEKALNC